MECGRKAKEREASPPDSSSPRSRILEPCPPLQLLSFQKPDSFSARSARCRRLAHANPESHLGGGDWSAFQNDLFFLNHFILHHSIWITLQYPCHTPPRILETGRSLWCTLTHRLRKHGFEGFSPQNETLRFELAFLHAQGHLKPTMNDLHYREGLVGAGSPITQIRSLTSPG
jgi:hypothetical protein